MIIFDDAIIKAILIEEGYQDEGEMDMIFSELNIIDASLQRVLDAYLTDRTIIDEFAVEGLTMNIIMNKFRCDFWHALGFMNTSINNPQLAKDLFNLSPMPCKE